MEPDGVDATQRLRGTSVLAAPLFVVAVIALSFAVASLSWAGFGDRQIGAVTIALVVVPALVGAAALVAIRGCFVEVAGGTVRDVAGWVTIRRIDQHRIGTARVRSGPWRLYVLDLLDGTAVKLVGASPQQFPAHLLPDARTRDLEDLDVLLGPDPA